VTASKGTSAEEWTVELFANPDKNVYLIMITCAFVLAFIGLIIIILHIHEKKEDKARTQLPDF
jgi:hypothetical protein